MHDIALWQIVATAGGALVVIDRAGSALVHLGLVPARLLRWLQRLWSKHSAERERERQRDEKIDIILAEHQPNGGGSMKDALTRLDKDFSAFAAESSSDRAQIRVLVNDLSARVEQSLHTDTREGK